MAAKVTRKTAKSTAGKNAKLYTVGYEGQDIDHFVKQLKKNKIKKIADLRKNPLSRKPGFSKTRLAAALDASGIAYVHYSGLGVPSEWRRQARVGMITREEMFERYETQILPQHKEELEEVEASLYKPGFAILCYEAEAGDCHRRNVAEHIVRKFKRKKQKLDVIDLHIDLPPKTLR